MRRIDEPARQTQAVFRGVRRQGGKHGGQVALHRFTAVVVLTAIEKVSLSRLGHFLRDHGLGDFVVQFSQRGFQCHALLGQRLQSPLSVQVDVLEEVLAQQGPLLVIPSCRSHLDRLLDRFRQAGPLSGAPVPTAAAT